MGEVTKLDVLVLVKAYPNPSRSLGEACCVMGLNRERGFVRLYPIPFRSLDDERKFRKYQVIRLRVHEPKNDPRPNTFRPALDSIEVVSAPLPSGKDWAARREWVEPWIGQSMCDIARRQAQDGTTMGMFRPAQVMDLTQSPEEAVWSEKEMAKLGQRDMFLTRQNKLLEKIPFKWRYRYRCAEDGCCGHHQ